MEFRQEDSKPKTPDIFDDQQAVVAAIEALGEPNDAVRLTNSILRTMMKCGNIRLPLDVAYAAAELLVGMDEACELANIVASKQPYYAQAYSKAIRKVVRLNGLILIWERCKLKQAQATQNPEDVNAEARASAVDQLRHAQAIIRDRGQAFLDAEEYTAAQVKAATTAASMPYVNATPKPRQAGPPWTSEKLNDFIGELTIPAPAGSVRGWASISVESIGAGYGYLFQIHWTAKDTTTGEETTQHSAKHYLSRHAAKNEIAQAILAAVIRASEHEIRERFQYDGVAVYRPHQSLEALHTFTRCTPPELRAEA